MTDISRFFALDPLNQTNADIDTIIEYFRAGRVTFNLTGKIAPKEAKATTDLKKSGLSLNDIDIDL